MKKALCLLAVLGVFCTTACGNPKLENGDDAVAKIDTKEISANELYEELKGRYGYNIVINMLDTALAEAEVETTKEIEDYAHEGVDFYKYYAESSGMTLEEFAMQYLYLDNIKTEDDLKQYLIVDRKLSIAVENAIKAKLTDKEIKDFYDENYTTIYTYREIILDATSDDADDEVNDVLKALKDKKGDELVKAFEEQAKDVSLGSTASEGGLHTKATKNTVDSEVWKKLKDLKDNEYTTKAIKSGDQYYIVLRISKDESSKLEDVEDEIRTTIANDKISEDELLKYDILTELRNKHKIAFFDEDLENSYNDYLKEIEDYRKQIEEATEE